MYIAADCCLQRNTVSVIVSVLLYSTFIVKYCTNCTVCNWTVLTVITQKLLLHVQLHNSTAHLLYKYCTNCTVCHWSVLTVITQKLLLHVQLYNSTAYLLNKYCTKCRVCNRTVLTVTTQKLLLHFQLHNSSKHLRYKLYILPLNCTYGSYTQAAATCSAAQQGRNCPADVFWSRELPVAW